MTEISLVRPNITSYKSSKKIDAEPVNSFNITFIDSREVFSIAAFINNYRSISSKKSNIDETLSKSFNQATIESINFESIDNADLSSVHLAKPLMFRVEKELQYEIFINDEYDIFAYGVDRDDVIDQLDLKLKTLFENLSDGSLNQQNTTLDKIDKLKGIFSWT